ncbi:MAG: ribonuclease PH, partial [Anaerolineae bacterium]
QVAAISVGLVNGVPLLDLPYDEDVRAEVDLNVVMTAVGDLIEVQGTGEKAPFSRRQLDELVDLAAAGIRQLCEQQTAVLNVG